MSRILGVDLPEQKKIGYALISIYGVGRNRATQVLKEANIDSEKRTRDLTTLELSRIQRVLERFRLEGDLRREENDNIDRLIRIQCYRGKRHQAKLPSRGQRTRTNGRTARGGGRRRTVGSLTKDQAAKLETPKTK